MHNHLKRLLLSVSALACSTFLPAAVHAQGQQVPIPVIQGPTGAPRAGATITVCGSPAVLSNGICTNFASIFSDVALTQAINQATTPLTTDGLGNCCLIGTAPITVYAAPGLFTFTVSGTGIAAPRGPYTVTAPCIPGVSCLSNPTATLTVTGALNANGTNTFKNLNAMQFADQYSTTSAVGNPVGLANIAGSAVGGSVAANTYACEVTYNGATSGETQASPTSGTITTSGAISQLSCAPSDVQTGNTPAGALTYNVYWQTGGAGSYFKGHSSVSLTTTDVQTATPATSGSTPPVSNTAIGILPTAQAALGGNPGTLVIPTTEPANSGWPGTPLTGQTFWDQRNGIFFSNTKNSIPNWIASNDTSLFTNNQSNPLLGINLNGINFAQQYHAAHFGTNTLFFANAPALAVGVKTTAGSTIGEVDGIFVMMDTFNPGQNNGGSNSVAIGTQNRCHATNCHIWGLNPLVQEESGFRPEFANTIEADYNNNSGTDAVSGQALIEDGIDIISGGTNKPRGGLEILANIPAGNWQEGIGVQSYQTLGIRFQTGAVGSIAEYIVPPDNTTALEVVGRNAANTVNNWSIQNGGNATFPLVNVTTLLQMNGVTIADSSQNLFPNNLSIKGGGLLISATVPTIATGGCGGSAASISAPNGTASFNIFTGTAPTSGGCTITMPAATTDWNCTANHVSAISTTNFIIQQTGALSTTSVTLQLFSDVAAATAPTASDTWRVTCTAN